MKNLCLHALDVERITGKSYRTGNRILARIRKKKGKVKGQCVTLAELCEELQISYEEAERFLYGQTA